MPSRWGLLKTKIKVIQTTKRINCFVFSINLLLSFYYNADKQCYKPNDEIAQETIDNNNAAAIIKSASTPASLQTIVRFSNGSNMSLQHKVRDFY